MLLPKPGRGEHTKVVAARKPLVLLQLAKRGVSVRAGFTGQTKRSLANEVSLDLIGANRSALRRWCG